MSKQKKAVWLQDLHLTSLVNQGMKADLEMQIVLYTVHSAHTAHSAHSPQLQSLLKSHREPTREMLQPCTYTCRKGAGPPRGKTELLLSPTRSGQVVGRDE
jgi:hypothetical protein